MILIQVCKFPLCFGKWIFNITLDTHCFIILHSKCEPEYTIYVYYFVNFHGHLWINSKLGIISSTYIMKAAREINLLQHIYNYLTTCFSACTLGDCKKYFKMHSWKGWIISVMNTLRALWKLLRYGVCILQVCMAVTIICHIKPFQFMVN